MPKEFIKEEPKKEPPEKQIEVLVEKQFEDGPHVSAWTPLARVGQSFEVDAYIIDREHHGHKGKALVEYQAAHSFQIRDKTRKQYFVSIPYIKAAHWKTGKTS